MNEAAALQTQATKEPPSHSHSLLVQRKCACGGSSGLTGTCFDCEKKKLLGQPLQTKLRINEPGDEYEREADRVAAHVMHMPNVSVGRDTASPPVAPLVQRRVNGMGAAGIGTAPPIVHDVLASPGQPLDAASRSFFEPRFRRDFADVRIHSDRNAARSAESIKARAYTVGQQIVLGDGIRPSFGSGDLRVLAHELAHVVQQTGGRSKSPVGCLTATAPQINRAPQNPPGQTPTPQFHSIPVGHGAFDIILDGERVIFTDAGTRGQIAHVRTENPALIDDAIDLAQNIVPNKIIHELRITHAHLDHYNFVTELLSRRFEIKLIEVNLYQLEFRKRFAELVQKLPPTTDLRIIHANPSTGEVSATVIKVSSMQGLAHDKLVQSLRNQFPNPSQFELTEEAQQHLGENVTPVEVAEKLRPIVGMRFDNEDRLRSAIIGQLTSEEARDWMDHIVVAAVADTTGFHTEGSSRAFLSPEFARRHLAARLSVDRGKKPVDLADKQSTIYVDDTLEGLRIVHGSDLRVADWIELGENEAFNQQLLVDVPETTLWIVGHHMSKGFLGASGELKPAVVLTFLDQMIERTLAPSATGRQTHHVASASINNEGLSLSIFYLLAASGFDIRITEFDALVTGTTPAAARPAAALTGSDWNLLLPNDHPLSSSLQTLQRLRQVRGADPQVDTLVQAIEDARLDFVIAVLTVLHGNINQDLVTRARNNFPQTAPALESAVALRSEATERDVLWNTIQSMIEDPRIDKTQISRIKRLLNLGDSSDAVAVSNLALKAADAVLGAAQTIAAREAEANQLLQNLAPTGGDPAGPAVQVVIAAEGVESSPVGQPDLTPLLLPDYQIPPYTIFEPEGVFVMAGVAGAQPAPEVTGQPGIATVTPRAVTPPGPLRTAPLMLPNYLPEQPFVQTPELEPVRVDTERIAAQHATGARAEQPGSHTAPPGSSARGTRGLLPAGSRTTTAPATQVPDRAPVASAASGSTSLATRSGTLLPPSPSSTGKVHPDWVWPPKAKPLEGRHVIDALPPGRRTRPARAPRLGAAAGIGLGVYLLLAELAQLFINYILSGVMRDLEQRKRDLMTQQIEEKMELQLDFWDNMIAEEIAENQMDIFWHQAQGARSHLSLNFVIEYEDTTDRSTLGGLRDLPPPDSVFDLRVQSVSLEDASVSFIYEEPISTPLEPSMEWRLLGGERQKHVVLGGGPLFKQTMTFSAPLEALGRDAKSDAE